MLVIGNGGVAAAGSVGPADASVTKVFASERLQQLGQLLEELVGRYGDPADEDTAELVRWLDIQAKRNTVLTFGGGVNELQRELIATVGLGLPRVLGRERPVRTPGPGNGGAESSRVRVETPMPGAAGLGTSRVRGGVGAGRCPCGSRR